jgi:hypothetical protein
MRLGLALSLFTALAAYGAPPVSFNRDIRPIMSGTCFRCHGPDHSSRMANLRLDLREEAIKPNRKGDAPIVPGNAQASLIVKRIFSENAAMLMPPRSSHKELTAAQKEAIRQWVNEGAVYEGHWAYRPLKRPAAPAAGNPIDAFIAQRLTAAGLEPSPEAGRRTLLRRVTLDLTGLPPTPEELDSFEADRSADAYRKVVDRLIASPRYAERQSTYWLDSVRYADTCGFHGDNAFPAWPFRDYVLRSIRGNKPFDQFTREQLAGDLLPDATDETRVASAYNRLTRTSAEGGLQPKEYLAKYGADRVRTLSSVWLGSTMGCAECHDHKFDPILARDFYSMKAFFADVKETGLVPDQGAKAWGELLMLPDADQKIAWASLERRIADARQALDAKRESLGAAYEDWGRQVPGLAKDWVVQYPLAASTKNGARLTLHKDEPVLSIFDFGGSVVNETKPAHGIVIASGPNPDNETYTLTLRPGAGTWYSLGLEALSDDRLPGARLARGSDRLVVTELEASAAAGKPIQFTRARSNLTFWDSGLSPWNAIDGKPDTGWGAATYRTFRTTFLAADMARPLTTTAASTLTVTIRHDSAFRRAVTGRFRLALAASPYAQPSVDRTQNPTISGLAADLRKALETGPAQRSEQQSDDVRALLDSTHADLAPLWNTLSSLESGRAVLRAQIPQVVSTVAAAEPMETRILPRGNFLDESGPVVEPAVPVYFGKLDTPAGRRATRLDLANWLVSPQNPLTARTYVNRAWRQLFGTGLSRVLEDLGSQGEWPTHPELLDWLAAEFIEPTSDPAPGAHAWDMQHLVRTIVLSRTYRQSSIPSKAMLEKDPDNRLLARQSRFRVDAETVRDVALAVSGLLAERFGGPSVRPYQPEGYLAALNFPKRDYSESRGEDLYRRGLYSFWQRTFLNPSLAAFDAPTREECTVSRTLSNTPLQSLVMLNDITFVEAARVFAQNMMAHGGKTFDARLDFAFRRAVGRPPETAERAILRSLYAKELARFRTAPADAKALLATGEAARPASANPVELAATASVARAILNLHETITRN